MRTEQTGLRTEENSTDNERAFLYLCPTVGHDEPGPAQIPPNAAGVTVVLPRAGEDKKKGGGQIWLHWPG